MAYSFANLTTPENTSPGVGDYILVAPVRDFETDGLKCPTAPFVNRGDEIKILTSHVFKSGKGFMKIQLAPDKNEFNGETIGDKGFNKFDFKYNVFIAGSKAEAHEAVKNLLNIPLIAIGPDSNCDANLWYQLGCDCLAAYMTFSWQTQTTVGTVKGYTGVVSWQNPYVQLYAVGNLAELTLVDEASSSV